MRNKNGGGWPESAREELGCGDTVRDDSTVIRDHDMPSEGGCIISDAPLPEAHCIVSDMPLDRYETDDEGKPIGPEVLK